MAKTGLRLNRVSISCMEASGRPLPENHDGTICIGRLQPDLVLVSQSLRKIADGSGPWNCLQDGSLELLAAAHERKVRTYAPLLEALQAYLDEGWQVESFPWVIGVRYLLDSAAIKCCLEFLEIQRKCGRQIIEERPRSQ